MLTSKPGGGTSDWWACMVWCCWTLLVCIQVCIYVYIYIHFGFLGWWLVGRYLPSLGNYTVPILTVPRSGLLGCLGLYWLIDDWLTSWTSRWRDGCYGMWNASWIRIFGIRESDGGCLQRDERCICCMYVGLPGSLKGRYKWYMEEDGIECDRVWGMGRE